MQLFCFTYAGGNAAFFDWLDNSAHKGFEIIKLEYPGHGTRYKESLCGSIQELACNLYEDIRMQYKGEEYMLFGYSMGSLVAIEITRLILNLREISIPSHIFVAAHAPDIVDTFDFRSNDVSDEWVKQRTIAFGAIPPCLYENNSFWRVYLPIYRADYNMISKYTVPKTGLDRTIPITVLYSEEDTPICQIQKWNNYFENVVYHRYEGSHFFIKDSIDEVINIIETTAGEK